MRLERRTISTLATVGAIALALCLGGCGRKSGLDLPPSAAAAPPATEQKAQALPISRPARPAATVAPKRALPIDVLLN